MIINKVQCKIIKNLENKTDERRKQIRKVTEGLYTTITMVIY